MSLQPIYTADATVTSGREGHGETSDGTLKVDLAPPKEFGTHPKAGATNPEQLFAIGYASCFGQAVKVVAGQQHVPLKDVQVTSHVTIGKNDAGGFGLAVALDVHLTPEVEKATAEKIVEAAHHICPYSNATRGNIDVKLNIV
ncbi:MAG: organic hydroperoxide resistance protein [Verrucomicrobia bacterium]|nr:organic hydroperoxide resistance protein [Verrucomicrobiota bacterium]